MRINLGLDVGMPHYLGIDEVLRAVEVWARPDSESSGVSEEFSPSEHFCAKRATIILISPLRRRPSNGRNVLRGTTEARSFRT